MRATPVAINVVLFAVVAVIGTTAVRRHRARMMRRAQPAVEATDEGRVPAPGAEVGERRFSGLSRGPRLQPNPIGQAMTDNAGEARQLEKWPGEEPLAVEAGTTEAASSAPIALAVASGLDIGDTITRPTGRDPSNASSPPTWSAW